MCHKQRQWCYMFMADNTHIYWPQQYAHISESAVSGPIMYNVYYYQQMLSMRQKK